MRAGPPVKAGDELENTRTGERLVVHRGSEDTNREHLVGDLFVALGGRVASPHYHPSLEERFEVVAGRIGFLLDGREQIGERGTKIVVPSGTVHDWWNAGDTEVNVLAEVRGPVHLFERVLETFWGLGTAGKTNRWSASPRVWCCDALGVVVSTVEGDRGGGDQRTLADRRARG